MESNRSNGEHEAWVRLRAIGQWVTHAEAGECTVAAAVEACVELAAAADRFLSEPEAA